MARRRKGDLPDVKAAAQEAELANRRRTAVWRHPDRQHIEDMLMVKSAYQVEKWLQLRYPVAKDPSNKRFHIPRKTLIAYRNRYLVDREWREPLDDSEFDEFYPARPPRRPRQSIHWEIEELETQVEVARMEYLRCKKQDEELGMTQESTGNWFQLWQSAVMRLLEYKSKLRGYDEYELVPIKTQQQIDQRQQIEQVNVNVDGGSLVKPDDPEKFEAARALIASVTDPDDRHKLHHLLSEFDPLRAMQHEIVVPDDGDKGEPEE
jgi:hypothetical protein